MCLDYVTKKFKPNDKMIVGYKIFEMDKWGHPQAPYKFGNFRLGKHYKSRDGILSAVNTTYENGFHFFTSKEAAFATKDNWRDNIYEVLLWDIRAFGKQWGQIVGVTKNMRIIQRVKE